MGFGDDIMATAFAKIEKEKYPNRQIVIGNFEKKIAFESIIFDNNPYITNKNDLDNNKPIHFVNNYPENRPYIDWEKTPKIYTKYYWNFNFSPIPGNIFLTNEEFYNASKILKSAKNYWQNKSSKKFKKIIFIEPSSTKISDSQFMYKHKNKDWGINNWKKLTKFLGNNYLLIQSVHNENIKLPNSFYCNIDFRTACALINICDLYVGPEGGLGHASAAFNKPAIILFGGWIHPHVTGYKFHENIYIDIDGSPCGSLSFECNHCKECMKKITNQTFIDALNKIN